MGAGNETLSAKVSGGLVIVQSYRNEACGLNSQTSGLVIVIFLSYTECDLCSELPNACGFTHRSATLSAFKFFACEFS